MTDMGRDDVPPGVDAALTRLQASVDRGFGDLRTEIASMRGSMDLLTQRSTQQDQRDDEQRRRADELDARVRAVEATAITRDEMDRQQRRTLAWVGLIVSIIGVVIGAAVSTILALLG